MSRPQNNETCNKLHRANKETETTQTSKHKSIGLSITQMVMTLQKHFIIHKQYQRRKFRLAQIICIRKRVVRTTNYLFPCNRVGLSEKHPKGI